MTALSSLARVLAPVLALAACSDRSSGRQPAREEPQRRVIEPPSGTVRPMPPHAIRSVGVGPY
ncbi:MAG: hypothetical protein WKG01_09505 [Kofleriaceae bacterium]